PIYPAFSQLRTFAHLMDSLIPYQKTLFRFLMLNVRFVGFHNLPHTYIFSRHHHVSPFAYYTLVVSYKKPKCFRGISLAFYYRLQRCLVYLLLIFTRTYISLDLSLL